MSKFNRVTQAVFADIVGTDDRISLYDRFLSTDGSLNIKVKESLKECKRLYSNIVKTITPDIQVLSSLEEMIIQIRCLETIDSHLKISANKKGHVYARALFFRQEKDVRDIRVFLGGMDTINNVSLAKEKLTAVMNKEIEETLKQIRKINK